MCTAVLTVASAIGSVMQGAAQRSAANAQAGAAEQNARIADAQAADSVLRGGAEEARFRRRLGGLVGSQNATAAASGLSSDSGSLSDARRSSLGEAERDIAINEQNTQRERWSHLVEAQNQRNAASAARAAGKNAFTAGLIGAGTSLVSLAAPTVDTIGGGITVGPVSSAGSSIPLGPERNTFDALNTAGYVPGGRLPYWRGK